MQFVARTNTIGHSFPFSPVHEDSFYIYAGPTRGLVVSFQFSPSHVNSKCNFKYAARDGIGNLSDDRLELLQMDCY